MRIFLTSSKKVGSNWLFNILVDLVKPKRAVRDRDIDRWNLHKYKDGVFKVHFVHPKELCDDKTKVISITRNLYDAITSLVLRKKFLLDLKENPSQFVFAYKELIEQQVQYWLRYRDGFEHENYLLVHYEDMIKDPFPIVKRICEFLGLKKGDDTIRKIVNKNSFEHVTGRKRGKEDKSSHNRKGVVGDYKNHLDEEAIKFIDYLRKNEEKNTR